MLTGSGPHGLGEFPLKKRKKKKTGIRMCCSFPPTVTSSSSMLTLTAVGDVDRALFSPSGLFPAALFTFCVLVAPWQSRQLITVVAAHFL